MKAKKQYDIHIFKLSNKTHHYEFLFDRSLFEMFEQSPIENGNGKVQVALEKTDTHIVLNWEIKGEVELVCDRSLALFMYPIKTEQKIWFKYGEAYDEQSEELIIIPGGMQIINVAKYIYEFILLEVPMKKLHPKFEQEEEEEDELVYVSEEWEEEETDLDQEKENENTEVDPRWAKLKEIQNKNKNELK